MTLSKYTIRMWSEFITYKHILRALPAMGQFRVGLIQAVDKFRFHKFQNIYDACIEHDVEIGIWPVLPRSCGYWLSALNLSMAMKFVEKLINTYPNIDLMALDFELPRHLNIIQSRITGWKSNRQHNKLQDDLDNLVSQIRKSNIDVLQTTYPLFPHLNEKFGIIKSSYASLYSMMLYTSYYQSFHLRWPLTNRVCTRIVYDSAKYWKEKYKNKAALDLGRISFGINRTSLFPLHSIQQKCAEISVALNAGIRNFQIFALDDNIYYHRKNYNEFFSQLANCHPKAPQKKQGFFSQLHDQLLRS